MCEKLVICVSIHAGMRLSGALQCPNVVQAGSSGPWQDRIECVHALFDNIITDTSQRGI